MLRLKVGKNYLLLDYHQSERGNIERAIPYMMGCFEGTNLLASCLSYNVFNADEVCKNMDALRTNKLYILQYVDVLGMKQHNDRRYLEEVIYNNRACLKEQVAKIKAIAYHSTNAERTMCAKNFPLEVFWRYLFFKKGSKNLIRS